MLIKRLLGSSREVIGFIEPAAPISIVPSHCPAANADNFATSDSQARRQRRQRRMELTGLRNVSGWTVRSW